MVLHPLDRDLYLSSCKSGLQNRVTHYDITKQATNSIFKTFFVLVTRCEKPLIQF